MSTAKHSGKAAKCVHEHGHERRRGTVSDLPGSRCHGPNGCYTCMQDSKNCAAFWTLPKFLKLCLVEHGRRKDREAEYQISQAGVALAPVAVATPACHSSRNSSHRCRATCIGLTPIRRAAEARESHFPGRRCPDCCCHTCRPYYPRKAYLQKSLQICTVSDRQVPIKHSQLEMHMLGIQTHTCRADS